MRESPNQDERCKAEIVDLHRFFVAWFHGRIPDDDASWSRVTEALAPGFFIVSPSGEVTEREALLTSLRKLHDCEASGSDFTIWIRDFRLRHQAGDALLVSYEEWHRREGREFGRISTALLAPDDAQPNGLCWQHVHETWLPAE